MCNCQHPDIRPITDGSSDADERCYYCGASPVETPDFEAAAASMANAGASHRLATWGPRFNQTAWRDD